MKTQVKLFVLFIILNLCNLLSLTNDDFLIGTYGYFKNSTDSEKFAKAQEMGFNCSICEISEFGSNVVNISPLVNNLQTHNLDAIVIDRNARFMNYDSTKFKSLGIATAGESCYERFYTVSNTGMNVEGNEFYYRFSKNKDVPTIYDNTGHNVLECTNAQRDSTVLGKIIVNVENNSLEKQLTGYFEFTHVHEYLKLTLRVNPINFANNEEIFKFNIATKNSTDILEVPFCKGDKATLNSNYIKTVTLTHNDFANANNSPNNYIQKDGNTGYYFINFCIKLPDRNDDPNPNCFPKSAIIGINSDYRTTGFSPLLTYLGSKNEQKLRIDYLEIQDDLYEKLNNNCSTTYNAIKSRIQYLKEKFGNNLLGLYTIDEPNIFQLRTYNLLQNFVKQEFPDLIFTSAQWPKPSVFGDYNLASTGKKYNPYYLIAKRAKPNYFMPDLYTFNTACRWHNSHSAQPNTTDINSNSPVEQLNKLGELYKTSFELIKTYNTNAKMYPVPQTYGKGIITDVTNHTWNWEGPIRVPYATMKAVMFMPLCYGASGVIPFKFSEEINFSDTTNSKQKVSLFSKDVNGRTDKIINNFDKITSTIKTYGEILKNAETPKEAIGTKISDIKSYQDDYYDIGEGYDLHYFHNSIKMHTVDATTATYTTANSNEYLIFLNKVTNEATNKDSSYISTHPKLRECFFLDESSALKESGNSLNIIKFTSASGINETKCLFDPHTKMVYPIKKDDLGIPTTKIIFEAGDLKMLKIMPVSELSSLDEFYFCASILSSNTLENKNPFETVLAKYTAGNINITYTNPNPNLNPNGNNNDESFVFSIPAFANQSSKIVISNSENENCEISQFKAFKYKDKFIIAVGNDSTTYQLPITNIKSNYAIIGKNSLNKTVYSENLYFKDETNGIRIFSFKNFSNNLGVKSMELAELTETDEINCLLKVADGRNFSKIFEKYKNKSYKFHDDKSWRLSNNYDPDPNLRYGFPFGDNVKFFSSGKIIPANHYSNTYTSNNSNDSFNDLVLFYNQNSSCQRILVLPSNGENGYNFRNYNGSPSVNSSYMLSANKSYFDISKVKHMCVDDFDGNGIDDICFVYVDNNTTKFVVLRCKHSSSQSKNRFYDKYSNPIHDYDFIEKCTWLEFSSDAYGNCIKKIASGNVDLNNDLNKKYKELIIAYNQNSSCQKIIVLKTDKNNGTYRFYNDFWNKGIWLTRNSSVFDTQKIINMFTGNSNNDGIDDLYIVYNDDDNIKLNIMQSKLYNNTYHLYGKNGILSSNKYSSVLDKTEWNNPNITYTNFKKATIGNFFGDERDEFVILHTSPISYDTYNRNINIFSPENSQHSLLNVMGKTEKFNSKPTNSFVSFNIIDYLTSGNFIGNGSNTRACNLSKEENSVPEVLKFSANNYPNPFNPETQINYTLPKATKVSIDVYNIKGQKVKTLVNKNKEKGHHKVIWKGKNKNNKTVSSGIYFYKVKTNKNSLINKMLLIK